MNKTLHQTTRTHTQSLQNRYHVARSGLAGQLRYWKYQWSGQPKFAKIIWTLRQTGTSCDNEGPREGNGTFTLVQKLPAALWVAHSWVSN